MLSRGIYYLFVNGEWEEKTTAAPISDGMDRFNRANLTDMQNAAFCYVYWPWARGSPRFFTSESGMGTSAGEA